MHEEAQGLGPGSGREWPPGSSLAPTSRTVTSPPGRGPRRAVVKLLGDGARADAGAACAGSFDMSRWTHGLKVMCDLEPPSPGMLRGGGGVWE